MTWGKVDPDKLPDSVTCYVDSTVALPLLAAYALSRRERRPVRRLMERMPELMKQLTDSYGNRRTREDAVAH
jgi:deoxyhypusine synthase